LGEVAGAASFLVSVFVFVFLGVVFFSVLVFFLTTFAFLVVFFAVIQTLEQQHFLGVKRPNVQ